MLKKGFKYEIFIGVKDKDTYLETLSIDEVKDILKEVCKDKEINFSLLTQDGGYKHHKGYTTETSLRVIIIDIDEKEIISLVDILKRRINTDTIMVTKTEIEYCFSFW
ncbi:MAG: hypothetical protein J6A47_06965 [Bacilli bacterium]|nr:hypothetical protein [Bacilli bacterium]MBO6285010.1 hypothetical protein [Bacilli bacterium]